MLDGGYGCDGPVVLMLGVLVAGKMEDLSALEEQDSVFYCEQESRRGNSSWNEFHATVACPARGGAWGVYRVPWIVDRGSWIVDRLPRRAGDRATIPAHQNQLRGSANLRVRPAGRWSAAPPDGQSTNLDRLGPPWSPHQTAGVIPGPLGRAGGMDGPLGRMEICSFGTVIPGRGSIFGGTGLFRGVSTAGKRG